MSNSTYERVNNKTVNNNSINLVKSVLIGAVSFFVPLTLGFSSNSSRTVNESTDVHEYRFVTVSADTWENISAYQLEDIMLNSTASTYTKTGADMSFGTINDYDERINSLILQLKEDEENETFSASDYITNLFSQDKAICVLVLEKTFVMESYKYATLVIDAIRLSDIDFLQKWFKDLLKTGMQKQAHRIYMEEIYELYEEELEAL